MSKIKFINNNLNKDSRGILNSVEAFQQTGIKYLRYFIIRDIKGGIRGGHAHKETNQIMQIIQGSILLKFQYFDEKGSYKLNRDSKPIFLPKLTWVEMSEITEDAIILVLSSDEYNIKKSIRDIDNYNSYIRDCILI